MIGNIMDCGIRESDVGARRVEFCFSSFLSTICAVAASGEALRLCRAVLVIINDDTCCILWSVCQ